MTQVCCKIKFISCDFESFSNSPLFIILKLENKFSSFYNNSNLYLFKPRQKIKN